eukprot:TRINITY_DN1822_c0_g1_i1.p1 TRINITY_DN1822_c0_g1~~TRINITY_DN1822_c0_g1_i1.p1  ORF type:complete len:289 (+),score=65.08 TRINITY_DN1822_c0_g1_i1:27-869(+)
MDPTLSQHFKTFLNSLGLNLTRILFSHTRSCIFEVQNVSNQEVSAMKVRLYPNPYLKYEAEILRMLEHNHIIKEKGYFENELFCMIQLEKHPGSALTDILKIRGPSLPEAEVRCIAQQIFSALWYLHTQNLVHLDIKLDNIMYNEQTQEITLIDFENVYPSSTLQNAEEIKGSLSYRAPEAETGLKIGAKAQIWTLGVSIFVLLTGKFPEFQKKELKAIPTHFHSMKKRVQKKRTQWVLECPQNVSEEAQEFLGKTLQVDPNQRSDLENLSSLKWLQTGD